MNLGRAFNYALEDENWNNKLPLTLLIGIIPIANFAVIGWSMDLIRNMLEGQEHPMPGWQDPSAQFGRRWMCGLRIALVGLIYYIPMLVVEVIANGTFGGAAEATNNFGIMAATGFALSCVMSILSAVYWAVVWLPLSIGILRFARSRNLGDMLEISQNFSVARQNLATMITLAVLVIIARLVLSVVFLVPCIGWLLALFSLTITAVVLSHLIGQAGLMIEGLDGTA